MIKMWWVNWNYYWAWADLGKFKVMSKSMFDIGSLDHFYYFWIQKSHHFYDFWIQKSSNPFSQILDPETAVILQFLDP